MTNPKDYLAFFPGQGICLVPSGGGLILVPKKEDAMPILEDLSSLVLEVNERKEIHPTAEAIALYETYKKEFGNELDIQSSIPIASTEALAFNLHTEISSSGTRISFNKNQINWENLESTLAAQGYALNKRKYFSDAVTDICPVYVLSHPDKGVVSEGKGIDDAQAKKSCMAEGVERIIGADHDFAAERSCLSREVDFKNKQEFSFGDGPRDSFSPTMLAEWIPGLNISTNQQCFMPTELAYFQYEPQKSHLRLFSLTHTMGHAAGSSIEDAALSGIMEVLERDAYWIIMRNRINCPDINLSEVPGLTPQILKIISTLTDEGITLSIKDASLDWGIAIAHVVLSDTKGRIPAFAHGMGAGFDWATAITRAVTEVVQVHSGLYAYTQEYGMWQDVVGGTGILGRPEFAWSDPLFYPHIEHLLIPSKEKSALEVSWKTPKALIEHLTKIDHQIMIAKLGEIEGLSVVRVLISGTTHPDERLERVTERMRKFADPSSKGFYSDPILT
jgi:thiazole/oxazole-forming peptide maturase SagD family component